MTNRPSHIVGDMAELYDWFAANGVDEDLPEQSQISLSPGKLTLRTWTWPSDVGYRWDTSQVVMENGEMATTLRTVPLRAPLTDRIRALLGAHGVDVVTIGPWPAGHARAADTAEAGTQPTSD